MKKILKRNILIDTIKGVAITLMVIGHCIQYGSGTLYLENGYFFQNTIFKFIYSFHMPLFMVVSGYLFYYSIKKYDFMVNIKNRVTQLLIPIVFHAFVKQLIHFIINRTIAFSIDTFIYNLWFLWAILFCSLIILITNKLFKDNLLVYIAIFCLLYFLPDRYNINLYSYTYVYFILGYLVNKYNIKCKNENKRNAIAIVSCFIFAILLCFYNYNSYIYTSGCYILKGNVVNQLLINLYRTIIGLIGSVSVVLILKIIEKKGELKLLPYIGKYSLGIYLISDIIFLNIFPLFNFYIPNINYFLIFMETLFVIVLSILISKLIQKNKLLNKLFFGGR